MTMAAFVARRALTAIKFASTQRCLATIQIQTRQFSFSKCLSTRRFTEKHEWIVIENEIGTVGISDHAQEQLGEIVYVEPPEVGAELAAEDVAGCLESVKAASDVFCPVDGVVSEVNEELGSNPSLVNKDPFEAGWLFKVKVDSGTDVSGLMDDAAYKKFVQQAEH